MGQIALIFFDISAALDYVDHCLIFEPSLLASMMLYHTSSFLLNYIFVALQNIFFSFVISYIQAVSRSFLCSFSAFSIIDHLPPHSFAWLSPVHMLPRSTNSPSTYFINSCYFEEFIYTSSLGCLVTTDSRHPKVAINFLTSKIFSYFWIN